MGSFHTAPSAAWRRRLLKVWTGTLKTSDLISVERERIVVRDLSDIRNADRLGRDLEAVAPSAPPTPTQLFCRPVRVCFHLKNPPRRLAVSHQPYRQKFGLLISLENFDHWKISPIAVYRQQPQPRFFVSPRPK